VAQTIPEGCPGAVAQEALSPWPLKFEPLPLVAWPLRQLATSCSQPASRSDKRRLPTATPPRLQATRATLRNDGVDSQHCRLQADPKSHVRRLDDRCTVTAAVWPLRDGKWGWWNVLSTGAGVLPGTTRKAARSACQAQGCIDRDQHLLCLRHPDNLKQIAWATLPGFPATMFRLLKAP
jgi:hypothetical protein